MVWMGLHYPSWSRGTHYNSSVLPSSLSSHYPERRRREMASDITLISILAILQGSSVGTLAQDTAASLRIDTIPYNIKWLASTFPREYSFSYYSYKFIPLVLYYGGALSLYRRTLTEIAFKLWIKAARAPSYLHLQMIYGPS